MSPSYESPSAKDKAAAVVDDVTGGFTANESIPEIDTSTTARGSAADDVVGNESVGGHAAKSNAAAASRHRNPDNEPPRLSKDQKPDITAESAPAGPSVTKTAPKFNTDRVPPNGEDAA